MYVSEYWLHTMYIRKCYMYHRYGVEIYACINVYLCVCCISCGHRPREMFHNRLEVEYIAMKDAVKLDANHLLVVYKQESGHIERRVVDGPTIFIPSAHEW